jgi:hypothetical protein
VEKWLPDVRLHVGVTTEVSESITQQTYTNKLNIKSEINELPNGIQS